jgi:hypothetical protein
MEQQLTLDFPTEHPSKHRMVILKNDRTILSIETDSLVEAQDMRRMLVLRLQENPHHHTVWEERPRSTGWWGLKSGQPNGAVVYNIIIESTETETGPHECIHG